MRTETLHEVLHAAPFRPFTLCLADGARVDVPHPDLIAHPPGRVSRWSWAGMSPRITSTSRSSRRLRPGRQARPGRSQKTPTAGIDGRASLARIRTDRWSPLPWQGDGLRSGRPAGLTWQALGSCRHRQAGGHCARRGASGRDHAREDSPPSPRCNRRPRQSLHPARSTSTAAQDTPVSMGIDLDPNSSRVFPWFK